MFTVEEHVQIRSGEDKGKRGRITWKNFREKTYVVYIFDDKTTKQYSEDELLSLED